MVDVRQVVTVEGVLESRDLVGVLDQRVEQIDNSAFILIVGAAPDSDWGERFPKEGLADVSRDEKRDSTADSVTLLHHLVEHDDNNASESKLQDNEDTTARADVRDVTVHAGPDVSEGLTDRDDDSHELLGTGEEGFVLCVALVNVDEL